MALPTNSTTPRSLPWSEGGTGNGSGVLATWRRHRERLLRLGSHTIWSAAGHFVNLGVQRLVFFPVLALLISEDAFGTFLIALGLVNMIGLAPSNGLMAHVLRDAAKYEPADQRLLIRTSTIMTALATLPIAVGLAVAAPWIAGAYGIATLAPQVVILSLYLLVLNVTETILCIQRVRRDFRYIALVHTSQGLLVFTALPLLPIMGLLAIPVGHVIGAAATLIFQLAHRRDELLERPYFARRLARDAFATWWPMSLSTLALGSAGYLDRLLLGLWWPERDVATFFAAVGTAAVFSVPGAVLSSVILSLLARFERASALSRSLYFGYAIGIVVFSALMGVLGVLLGPTFIGILYPRMYEDALPLWSFAVWAAVVTNLHALARPFIVKFLAISWVPALAYFGLAARVVPLLLLVPSGGQRGAVQAMLIGSAIASAAWYALYVYKLVLRSPKPPTDGHGGASAEVIGDATE